MTDVHSWPSVLSTLLAADDLSPDAAGWAMGQVLAGEATSAQIAGFVTALRAKGETAVEVDALVSTMLANARLVDLGADGPPVVLDVVGTGGDRSHSVNISTMTALVCAAAGAPVVKHGNRAASSSTGTADVLEELGVVVDLEPDAVGESLRRVGIGFCFAATHHPAMRHAGPTRRELGVPTVFNILGPLTNPAGAQAALIGCANEALAPVMADVLHRRGVRALVVRGADGLDEISVSEPTMVWDATGDAVATTAFDPAELGLPHVAPELIRGGDRALNARLLRAALDPGVDADVPGDRVAAIREAIVVNAAAAMVAFDAAQRSSAGSAVDVRPLAERVGEQVPTVRETLDSGAAARLLDTWIAVTQTLRRPSAI